MPREEGVFTHEKVYRTAGTSYQANVFLIGQDRCDAASSHTAVLDAQISARLPNMTRLRACRPSLLLLIGDYGWVNQWKPVPHARAEWKELAEWHDRVDCHNLAFLDCHVKFLNIRKGFWVTSEYCVLPFQELFDLAYRVQEPAP